MSESHGQARLLKSSASSVTRVMRDRTEVAGLLADGRMRDNLKQLVKPNSVSKTMRKVGVALLLSPDPITNVPGAIMLGASFATRARDPLSLGSVFVETRKLMLEIGSCF